MTLTTAANQDRNYVGDSNNVPINGNSNVTGAGNNDLFQLSGTSNTTATGTGTHAPVAGLGSGSGGYVYVA